MKKSHVMVELKKEYNRNPDWTKDRKAELAAKYDVSYAQLYKLHWDWKEREIKMRRTVSIVAEKKDTLGKRKYEGDSRGKVRIFRTHKVYNRL